MSGSVEKLIRCAVVKKHWTWNKETFNSWIIHSDDFPLLRAINIAADRYGPCRGEKEWKKVAAHAHVEDGVICIKDHDIECSTILHEYAHLMMPPKEYHSPQWAECNKQLHQQYGVWHDYRTGYIRALLGSVIFAGSGLAICLIHGDWLWGSVMLGAGLFGILAILHGFCNSFQLESKRLYSKEVKKGIAEPSMALWHRKRLSREDGMSLAYCGAVVDAARTDERSGLIMANEWPCKRCWGDSVFVIPVEWADQLLMGAGVE